MRTREIKALTGLRIVAAAWVVLFHFRPLLRQAAPTVDHLLAPVLSCGAQGVDLFFILSGYVLTLNYLDRMGESWSLRGTLRFLWLRLARVWPVYLVTMHLAALWIIFTLKVGHVPAQGADQLTAVSYVRQLFLVQLWSQPYFDWSSWDGPSWSISAEWLAYLLFGALVLVLFRMALNTRARGLFGLAFLVSLPPLLLLVATGQFYTPWSWLLRIVMQFTAGALACVAVRRLRLTERMRRGAGYLSIGLLAAIIGPLYLFSVHPLTAVRDCGGLVDVLFLPLVVTLAVGAGTLPRLLSTRLLVYGGQISFSLYLVHEIVQSAWEWAQAQFAITLPSVAAKLVFVGLLAVAVAAAMILFRYVEEPSRQWMRRMIDRSDTNQRYRIDPPDDPGGSDPHPVDGPLTAGTKPATVGAM